MVSAQVSPLSLQREYAMTPDEIVESVRSVLQDAARGKGSEPGMPSSFQVLERLPELDRLIEQRGRAGGGVGRNHGAAHIVAQALDMVERRREATSAYMDTRGVRFSLAGEWIEPGYGRCKLFRTLGSAE
jgi:hypothetical protein